MKLFGKRDTGGKVSKTVTERVRTTVTRDGETVSDREEITERETTEATVVEAQAGDISNQPNPSAGTSIIGLTMVQSDPEQPKASQVIGNFVLGLGSLAQSDFVRGIVDGVLKDTVKRLNDKLQPPTATYILTVEQAHRVSSQLQEVLDGLVSTCSEQKRKLAVGFMPWDKPSSVTIASSVYALPGITDRLAWALEGIEANSKPANARGTRAGQPSTTSQPRNTGPSLAAIKLRPGVSPEQLQQVAEVLRNLHQYIIEASNRIKGSISGAEKTNAFALDAALAEASTLVQVLREARPQLEAMLAGPSSPRLP
jgi:hypothetical protein